MLKTCLLVSLAIYACSAAVVPEGQVEIDVLDRIVSNSYAWPSFDNYIVHGRDAQPAQFPWHVSILRPDNHEENRVHVAGGSILSPEWILTAAHVAEPLHHYTLRFGSLNLWTNGEVQVSNESIIHEGYNRTTLANNIALIRIPTPLQLGPGSALQAVRLPCAGDWDTLVGRRARTAGHGLTQDGEISEQLQFVDLQLIDNRSCRGTFGSRVTEHIICGIGWENRNQNTCGGDSGGALSVRANGHWVQAGLTAFGALKACDRGFPSAFTRLSSYGDWIEQSTGVNLRAHCANIGPPPPGPGIVPPGPGIVPPGPFPQVPQGALPEMVEY